MRAMSVTPELKEEAEQFVSEFKQIQSEDSKYFDKIDFTHLADTISFTLSFINNLSKEKIDAKIEEILKACDIVLESISRISLETALHVEPDTDFSSESETDDDTSNRNSLKSVVRSAFSKLNIFKSTAKTPSFDLDANTVVQRSDASDSSDDESVYSAAQESKVKTKDRFIACLGRQKIVIEAIKNDHHASNMSKTKDLVKAILHIRLNQWLNKIETNDLNECSDALYTSLAMLPYELQQTPISNRRNSFDSSDQYEDNLHVPIIDFDRWGIHSLKSSALSLPDELELLNTLKRIVYSDLQYKIFSTAEEYIDEHLKSTVKKTFFATKKAKKEMGKKIDKDIEQIQQDLFFRLQASKTICSQYGIEIISYQQQLQDLDQAFFMFLSLIKDENIFSQLIAIDKKHILYRFERGVKRCVQEFLQDKSTTLTGLEKDILYGLNKLANNLPSTSESPSNLPRP